MEKLVRDGMVAVLYSPGFGAGWSTWARGEEALEMLFSTDIALLVESGASHENLKEAAEKLWPDEYLGGLEGIKIKWIPVGSLIKIDEYDGAETIVFKENEEWIAV